jgi:hypothetical protein
MDCIGDNFIPVSCGYGGDDLFVCFYGTTFAMSYLYAVDWAPIRF